MNPIAGRPSSPSQPVFRPEMSSDDFGRSLRSDFAVEEVPLLVVDHLNQRLVMTHAVAAHRLDRALRTGLSCRIFESLPDRLSTAGDVDGDGLADILIGAVLATPRIDPQTGEGTTHGGETYLLYGMPR